MKRVVFLQGTIPHYRVPFFEQLSELIELVVVHSDEQLREKQFSFPTVFSRSRTVGGFVFNRDLRQQLASLQPDKLVVMFDPHWVSFLRSFLQGPNGGRILWGHRQSKSFLANKIRIFFLKRADAIIQYSGCHVETMVASGVERKRIFVADNTISVPNSEDTSQLSGRSFLFVGRLQERKKVDLALKAFADSGVARQGFRFDVVGNGPEKNKLVELVDSLNLSEHVRFHGEVHDERDLKKLFSNSLAYISPGAVGLSVLHSFSYGVPVITHQYENHGPEYSNLLQKNNSIIYSSEKELPSVLRFAADNPAALIDMGSHAFEHFHQNRSMKDMVVTFSLALGR